MSIQTTQIISREHAKRLAVHIMTSLYEETVATMTNEALENFIESDFYKYSIQQDNPK